GGAGVAQLRVARVAVIEDVGAEEGAELCPPLVQQTPACGMILVCHAPGAFWLPVSSTSSSYRCSSPSLRIGVRGPECSASRVACSCARPSAGMRGTTAATTVRSLAGNPARQGGHGHLVTRPTGGLRSGDDHGVTGLEREVRALRPAFDQVRVADRDPWTV